MLEAVELGKSCMLTWQVIGPVGGVKPLGRGVSACICVWCSVLCCFKVGGTHGVIGKASHGLCVDSCLRGIVLPQEVSWFVSVHV